VQPSALVERLPDDGQDPLLPLDQHLDPAGRLGGRACCGLDLGQGPVDDGSYLEAYCLRAPYQWFNFYSYWRVR